MSRLTIYHNPRCSKSRDTLAFIRQQGFEPHVVAYLETPPTSDELRNLLKQLGMADARALIRKNEVEYKELGLANPSLSQDAIISALSAHPCLIERPIVVNDSKAVIGRPPENVLTIL
jgi:arsenate reductase